MGIALPPEEIMKVSPTQVLSKEIKKYSYKARDAVVQLYYIL